MEEIRSTTSVGAILAAMRPAYHNLRLVAELMPKVTVRLEAIRLGIDSCANLGDSLMTFACQQQIALEDFAEVSQCLKGNLVTYRAFRKRQQALAKRNKALGGVPAFAPAADPVLSYAPPAAPADARSYVASPPPATSVGPRPSGAGPRPPLTGEQKTALFVLKSEIAQRAAGEPSGSCWCCIKLNRHKKGVPEGHSGHSCPGLDELVKVYKAAGRLY